MTKSPTPNNLTQDDLVRQQQAEGRIRLGITRLMSKYPFHARVIERMVIQPAPTIPTMAVTV